MASSYQCALGLVLGSLFVSVLLGCGGGGGPSTLPSNRKKPDQAKTEKPTSTANPPGQEKLAPKELWTKTNTPQWVGKLPPKVKTAFNDLMNDESPLYTRHLLQW